MRPDIDVDDNRRDAVQDYAKANGLTMARAWAEIVEAGIEAVNDDDTDT